MRVRRIVKAKLTRVKLAKLPVEMSKVNRGRQKPRAATNGDAVAAKLRNLGEPNFSTETGAAISVP